MNSKKFKTQIKDPLNGYFKTNTRYVPDKNGLLDIAKVKRLFNRIHPVSENDCYTFQLALQSKSGIEVEINESKYCMLSSYDYLGLIGHESIENASFSAIKRYGTGSGGVRLLTGTTQLHAEFEKQLASFKGTESAITFASGYVANIAILSALLEPDDYVIFDSYIHQSVIDGCNLSRVNTIKFEHNNLKSLEEALLSVSGKRRILIVVEGVYSMEGDVVPLPDIIDIKKKYNAFLMVDEAHSFGVMGKTGRGINEYYNIPASEVDIWMGSLSKAIPSNGGYIAGSKELIIYLQHNASPFIFSAALSPVNVAVAQQSIKVINDDPQRIQKLNKNAQRIRSVLKELGYDTGNSNTHVIPVMIKNDLEVYKISRELYELGFLVTPVVFPAVPRGKARLRICANAMQDERIFTEIKKVFNIISRNILVK